MSLYVIGVDPGISGGIALIGPDALTMVRGEHMPTMEMVGSRGRKIVDVRAAARILDRMLLEASHPSIRPVAVLEKVHAMPKQGVASSFSFGHNVGMIEAVLRLAVERVSVVSASTWKPRMNLSRDKAQSLAMARDRFGPHEVFAYKTKDGVAEAALIAAYWHKEHAN